MLRKSLVPALIGAAALACGSAPSARSPEGSTHIPTVEMASPETQAAAADSPESEDVTSADTAAQETATGDPGTSSAEGPHHLENKPRRITRAGAQPSAAPIPGAAQFAPTGILECDRYLQAIQTCLSTSPAAAAALSQNLTSMRDAWTTVAASSPAGAQALAQACSAALGSLPGPCVP
jgi:hypothetical protein